MGQSDGSVVARIRRVIGLQAKAAVLIALLLAMFYGADVALSGLIGGAIGVIASWAYAISIALPRGSDPRLLLRGHYLGEFSRLAVTVCLFAVVFVLYKGVQPLPLFVTYAATLLMYWVALIVDN